MTAILVNVTEAFVGGGGLKSLKKLNRTSGPSVATSNAWNGPQIREKMKVTQQTDLINVCAPIRRTRG